MSAQLGYATQFGIPGGTATTITIGAVVYDVIRTYSYAKNAQTRRTPDNTGETKNVTTFDATETMSVDIIVSGTTVAACLADWVALPGIMTKVDIASPLFDTQIAGTDSGSNPWYIESAEKTATFEDHATVRLGLVRFTAELNTPAAS